MLSLDDLAGDWLAPEREEHFSLPAITNFHGTVQAAWDAAGIQNWICPPTGMATPTALLFRRDGDRAVRARRPVRYRWKAYEIERRGSGVASTLRMPAGLHAVAERIRFEEGGVYHLVFTGLPRTWRFTDYWNLPPEDVPMFNVRRSARGFRLTDTKTFGAAEFTAPGECSIFADLTAWLEGEGPCEQGKIGVATIRARPGQEVYWGGVQGCEEVLPLLDPAAAFESGREHWNEVWEAVFRRDNAHFSGHLPWIAGPLERLYAMSVLSLLQCRRLLPEPTRRALTATGGQCIWNSGEMRPLRRAYVWGGPEGGMTTLFLWELEFQAPVLARLDPAVLREQMEAMLRVDLERHWGVETVSGRGAGMGYGVNPGGFLSCVSDYVRITGDRQWAVDHARELARCLRPELTDYGSFENVLECVSTYEHAIAAFNALNVQGMRFVAEVLDDEAARAAADRLARAVLELYADGPFACLQPDGTRRVVRTVLDFVYVGRCMTRDLPPHVRQGMVAFFERELMTHDWLYALSPRDPDAVTRALPEFQTYRADHQSTGSYDGWPGRAASALIRLGERDKALRWLARLQEVTREGPFGQAHFVHPDGRARKASFYNGNCYFNAAGSAYAATILDDLGGKA